MRIDLIHDSGGYREEETPCPISNQEAKLFIADNTLSYWDGNVGRCQFRDSSLTFPFLQSPYSKYQKQQISLNSSTFYFLIYSWNNFFQYLLVLFLL